MKTLIKFLMISIISTSCNSQNIDVEFINSIKNSTQLSCTYTTKVQGKIKILYPNNLNSNFQNLINNYINEDLKSEICEGPDGVLEVEYKVKYYSNSILSIYKIESDDFCLSMNNTRYTCINLYNFANHNYLIELDTNSNVLVSKINLDINNLQSTECDYNYEDSLKGLLIYNSSSVKYFLIMDKICKTEMNIELNENYISSKILN